MTNIDPNVRDISKENLIREAIKQTNGKFFGVTFVKKDNSIREMNARLGVTSHLKGGTINYDPIKKGLLTVFDIQKNDYRSIALNTVISLKINGQVINFE